MTLEENAVLGQLVECKQGQCHYGTKATAAFFPILQIFRSCFLAIGACQELSISNYVTFYGGKNTVKE